ncbi:hypothetical protein Bwad005_10980 [Bilophila wadsworthia]
MAADSIVLSGAGIPPTGLPPCGLPTSQKVLGDRGRGTGEGKGDPFPSPDSLYNLILLTGWIEISGVTSWYETTGRP